METGISGEKTKPKSKKVELEFGLEKDGLVFTTDSQAVVKKRQPVHAQGSCSWVNRRGN